MSDLLIPKIPKGKKAIKNGHLRRRNRRNMLCIEKYVCEMRCFALFFRKLWG
jgi:hypothetical protein